VRRWANLRDPKDWANFVASPEGEAPPLVAACIFGAFHETHHHDERASGIAGPRRNGVDIASKITMDTVREILRGGGFQKTRVS
jgi:hypothetical protein